MELNIDEFYRLGRFLEGFFYGIYSGIFVIYLQSKSNIDRTKTIVFHALCALYVLSMAVIGLSIANEVVDGIMAVPISLSSSSLFGCCDFISQSILIYRCWIVWDRDTRVVIIPSILAIIFLALWLSISGSYIIVQGELFTAEWGYTTTLTSLVISMIVNALVTSLIVFRLIKIFREVKATPGGQKLGATDGRIFQSVVFILIESGSALFSIQLARLVVTVLKADSRDYALDEPYTVITSIHQVLNGITPTIILVRVSMGLSFHDEDSLVEATQSVCFAPNPNSKPETGCVDQESRDDDIEVQFGSEISDEIQMVDR